MNLNHQNTIYRTAEFKVCPQLGQIEISGQQYRLSPINMKVLVVLLQNRGLVISRNSIFQQVWKNQIVSDDTLTRCISDLRAQLGRYSSTSKLIETIPKKGYRWIPPVNETSFDSEELVFSKANDAQSSTLPNSNVKQQRLTTKLKANYWVAVTTKLVLFILALALLSMSFTWTVGKMNEIDTVKIAILPIQVDAPKQNGVAQEFEELLKEQLLTTQRLRYLSSRLIADKQKKLYPYLAREFSAQWIIEGKIRLDNKGVKITLNLVDARTALVAQTFSRHSQATSEALKEAANSLIEEIKSSI